MFSTFFCLLFAGYNLILEAELILLSKWFTSFYHVNKIQFCKAYFES